MSNRRTWELDVTLHEYIGPSKIVSMEYWLDSWHVLYLRYNRWKYCSSMIRYSAYFVIPVHGSWKKTNYQTFTWWPPSCFVASTTSNMFSWKKTFMSWYRRSNLCDLETKQPKGKFIYQSETTCANNSHVLIKRRFPPYMHRNEIINDFSIWDCIQPYYSIECLW